MTKYELVSHMADQANISKKAANAVLETIVQTVRESLAEGDGKFRISDLGTFRVAELSPRRGVNPRTLEEMTIPGMKVPRFTPSRALQRTVSETE